MSENQGETVVEDKQAIGEARRKKRRISYIHRRRTGKPTSLKDYQVIRSRKRIPSVGVINYGNFELFIGSHRLDSHYTKN